MTKYCLKRIVKKYIKYNSVDPFNKYRKKLSILCEFDPPSFKSRGCIHQRSYAYLLNTETANLNLKCH